MSGFPEQPFSDYEEVMLNPAQLQPWHARQRYFLAEILKASYIPTFHLLGFIEQAGIQPAWNELALPNGRSVSACQRAFNRLRSRAEFPVQTRPPAASENPLAGPKSKKRPSVGDLSTPSHPSPGFSSFPSVNQPSPAHGLPSVTTPGGKLQKKRGRPSKAEHELRAAEAAARGEIYPPPKKIKTPKTPGEEGMSTAITEGLSQAGTPGVPGSSEVKKRAPKAKAPKQGPAESVLQATADSANALGQPGQAAAPTTQPTDLGPSENLLAGLQEHAARPETSPTEQELRPSPVGDLPTTQTAPFLSSQNEPFPPSQNEPYQTPYQQTSSV